MIRQLTDPANAITATGIVLSVSGIRLAMTGHPELGVATVLWALLADHLDGVVAMRTKNRAPETGKVGKSLDSLADLLSAGVFPAVVVLQIGGASLLSVIAATVLVLASALRLSYFNAFGLADGRFIGVPTTYAVPVLAVVFLLRPLISEMAFPGVLSAALVILAILHVSRLPVPPTRGYMYAVVTAFAVITSAVLTFRGWRV